MPLCLISIKTALKAFMFFHRVFIDILLKLNITLNWKQISSLVLTTCYLFALLIYQFQLFKIEIFTWEKKLYPIYLYWWIKKFLCPAQLRFIIDIRQHFVKNLESDGIGSFMQKYHLLCFNTQKTRNLLCSLAKLCFNGR